MFRGMNDLQGSITSNEYNYIKQLPYLLSSEELNNYSQFITSLNNQNVTSKSFHKNDWDNTDNYTYQIGGPTNSSTYGSSHQLSNPSPRLIQMIGMLHQRPWTEGQHHWTKMQSGKSLVLLEGIELWVWCSVCFPFVVTLTLRAHMQCSMCW